jgi:hypothetical protein
LRFYAFIDLIETSLFNIGAAKVAPNVGYDERRRAVVCLELLHLSAKGHGLLLPILKTTVLQASVHHICRCQDRHAVVVVSVVVHSAMLQLLLIMMLLLLILLLLILLVAIGDWDALRFSWELSISV